MCNGVKGDTTSTTDGAYAAIQVVCPRKPSPPTTVTQVTFAVTVRARLLMIMTSAKTLMMPVDGGMFGPITRPSKCALERERATPAHAQHDAQLAVVAHSGASHCASSSMSIDSRIG